MIKQLVKRHDLKPRNTNFDDYFQETSSSLSPDLQRLRQIIEERKRQKDEDELLKVGDNQRIISLDRYKSDSKHQDLRFEVLRDRLQQSYSPQRKPEEKQSSPREYATSRFLDQVEAKKRQDDGIWKDDRSESNREVLAQINELRSRLDQVTKQPTSVRSRILNHSAAKVDQEMKAIKAIANNLALKINSDYQDSYLPTWNSRDMNKWR